MDLNNLAKLITDHFHASMAYALRLTDNLEDAEDLLQESFFKALRASGSFEQGTNFGAWMATIMKNTFINNCKRKSIANSHLHASLGEGSLCFGHVSNRAESNIVIRDVQDSLQALPEAYYVPLAMFIEGYKYEEISERLCLPTGTVKTRIHTARKLIKRNLIRKGYEHRNSF